MDDTKKAKIFGIKSIIFLILLILSPTLINYYINSLDSDHTNQKTIKDLTTSVIIIFIILPISTYFTDKKNKNNIKSQIKHALKLLNERYTKGGI